MTRKQRHRRLSHLFTIDAHIPKLDELAAVHVTRRSMEALELLGIARERLKVVVTRYAPANGLRSEDVESVLKIAPYALLANDYGALQRAILEGGPVPPGSVFRRGIHELANRLLGRQTPAPKKRGLWSGLLANHGLRLADSG